MKRFMSSRLITFVQDVLLDDNLKVIKIGYDEFVLFILSEKENFLNKDDYLAALVFTREELSELVDNFERSTIDFLRKANRLIDEQIIWVREQIMAEFNIQYMPNNKKNKQINKLQWTGSQIELVELLYSLHDAGSINNGKITIKELFSSFAEIFNFKITDYYRFFTDITHRIGDRTIYLNKLKKVFIQHLAKSDNH